MAGWLVEQTHETKTNAKKEETKAAQAEERRLHVGDSAMTIKRIRK